MPRRVVGFRTVSGYPVSLWSPKAPKRVRAFLRNGGTLRSERVRRQGLEPRTRGLRVGDLEYHRLTIDTVG